MDISIVIPTHNRSQSLRKCLDALLRQDLAEDALEIIVVDDGSTDGTRDTLSALFGSKKNLRYFYQKKAGPAAARNFGILQARADIVGFIDDDCLVAPSWARLMVDAHRSQPSVSAVGGLTVSEGNIPAMVSQFLSTGSIEVMMEGVPQVIFFPTCNVSFKRGIFLDNGFDSSFRYPGGEDLEFFWRLYKTGKRFLWRKDIKVLHARNIRVRAFIRQAFCYGRGNLRVQHFHRDHPLLKELKTGRFSFWPAMAFAIVKIPRFSALLGRRVVREASPKEPSAKAAVYAYLVLHKIAYLWGTILEYFSLPNSSRGRKIPSKTPTLLILDVTHRCNLQCLICDIWKTARSETDIDGALIRKMLSQAKASGIPEIALSGGEPLLRKDIYEIIAHARGEGIRNLGILTNGIVLKEYLPRLRPYLLDSTISLVVSLDSLRPEVHDHIRNFKSAWAMTMAGLNELASMKKTHPQVNFNVITIVLEDNLNELASLAGFVKSLGANSLQFQPLLSNNLRMAQRRQSRFWVKEENLALLDGAIEKVCVLKKESPAFIKNSFLNLALIKKYYRGSIAPHEVSCLSADKTVLVSNQGCCTTCFTSYGDLKVSGLQEILDGRQIVEARGKVKQCGSPCLLPCFCDQ